MKTRHQIVAALALATLALGCDDGAAPVDGSPPVAAADSAITDLDTPVLLQPTANDATDGACLSTETIDLDPTTAGQQDRFATAAGTFARMGSAVLFMPAAGFTGDAAASYVVADVAGRVSNPAQLIVTVRAAPSAATVDVLDPGETPPALPRLVPAAALEDHE